MGCLIFSTLDWCSVGSWEWLGPGVTPCRQHVVLVGALCPPGAGCAVSGAERPSRLSGFRSIEQNRKALSLCRGRCRCETRRAGQQTAPRGPVSFLGGHCVGRGPCCQSGRAVLCCVMPAAGV